MHRSSMACARDVVAMRREPRAESREPRARATRGRRAHPPPQPPLCVQGCGAAVSLLPATHPLSHLVRARDGDNDPGWELSTCPHPPREDTVKSRAERVNRGCVRDGVIESCRVEIAGFCVPSIGTQNPGWQTHPSQRRK
jgi:hypothetical protein